jgi:hypothetical protein
MMPPKHIVLGVGASATSYGEVLALCRDWIEHPADRARSISLLTLHSVMTAAFDRRYWALRSFGFRKQARVYGPDLILALREQFAIPIFPYGGRDETLGVLKRNLTDRFCQLRLLMEPRRLWKRYMPNPPFLAMWALELAGIRLIRAESR